MKNAPSPLPVVLNLHLLLSPMTSESGAEQLAQRESRKQTSEKETEGKAFSTLSLVPSSSSVGKRTELVSSSLPASHCDLSFSTPLPVHLFGMLLSAAYPMAKLLHEGAHTGNWLGKKQETLNYPEFRTWHISAPRSPAMLPESKALPRQPALKFTSRSKWNSLALREASYDIHFQKPSGTLGDTWTHQDPRSDKLGASSTFLKGDDKHLG